MSGSVQMGHKWSSDGSTTNRIPLPRDAIIDPFSTLLTNIGGRTGMGNSGWDTGKQVEKQDTSGNERERERECESET